MQLNAYRSWQFLYIFFLASKVKIWRKIHAFINSENIKTFFIKNPVCDWKSVWLMTLLWLSKSWFEQSDKKEFFFSFPQLWERQDSALKENDKFGSPAESVLRFCIDARARLSREKCHLQCLVHLHACWGYHLLQWLNSISTSSIKIPPLRCQKSLSAEREMLFGREVGELLRPTFPSAGSPTLSEALALLIALHDSDLVLVQCNLLMGGTSISSLKFV